MQLGQVQRAVALLDVAEDTAGADRGELLICWSMRSWIADLSPLSLAWTQDGGQVLGLAP